MLQIYCDVVERSSSSQWALFVQMARVLAQKLHEGELHDGDIRDADMKTYIECSRTTLA